MPTLQELLAESRRLEQAASKFTGIAPVLGAQGTPLTSSQAQSIISSASLTPPPPINVQPAPTVDPVLADFNKKIVNTPVSTTSSNTPPDLSSARDAAQTILKGGTNPSRLGNFTYVGGDTLKYNPTGATYSIATGQLLSGPTPPPASTEINPPETIPTQPSSSSTFFIPSPKRVTSIKDLEVPDIPLSPIEQGADTISNMIRAANEQLLGKSAFTLEKQKEFGIPEAQQFIDDLGTRLRDLKRKEAQINVEYGGALAAQKGVLEPFVTGERDARLRQNAIEALTVSAMMDAATQRLTSAQRKVDMAIQEKYGPIEEEIDIKTKNLNILLNSPSFKRSQEKQALQTKISLENQQARIKNAKDEQEAIWKVMLDAVQHGLRDPVLAEKIRNAGSREEALSLAAPFLNTKEFAAGDFGTLQRLLGRNPTEKELLNFQAKSAASERKPTTPTEGKPTNEDVKSLFNALSSRVGTDGFISPEDWATAKRRWIQEGFSAEDFDKRFGIFKNTGSGETYL